MKKLKYGEHSKKTHVFCNSASLVRSAKNQRYNIFQNKKSRHSKMFLVLVEKVSARSNIPCLRHKKDSPAFEKILTERKSFATFIWRTFFESRQRRLLQGRTETLKAEGRSRDIVHIFCNY